LHPIQESESESTACFAKARPNPISIREHESAAKRFADCFSHTGISQNGEVVSTRRHFTKSRSSISPDRLTCRRTFPSRSSISRIGISGLGGTRHAHHKSKQFSPSTSENRIDIRHIHDKSDHTPPSSSDVRPFERPFACPVEALK
jgi:hypothetical protein